MFRSACPRNSPSSKRSCLSQGLQQRSLKALGPKRKARAPGIRHRRRCHRPPTRNPSEGRSFRHCGEIRRHPPSFRCKCLWLRSPAAERTSHSTSPHMWPSACRRNACRSSPAPVARTSRRTHRMYRASTTSDPCNFERRPTIPRGKSTGRQIARGIPRRWRNGQNIDRPLDALSRPLSRPPSR